MLSNPLCFKFQRKLPVSWAPRSSHLSPHGQTAERSQSSIWTDHSTVWHWPVYSGASVGGEGRELWALLTRLLVTSVLMVQETGWELTAARRRLHTCANPVGFPLVILKISGRSESNVPCTDDISIDFKLCKLYCLKIFVKWLNWTFSKGALSISKLTTFKCIFLLLFLYSVSSCAQICAVWYVQ